MQLFLTRACLHGGGGHQVGEVTYLGGVKNDPCLYAILQSLSTLNCSRSRTKYYCFYKKCLERFFVLHRLCISGIFGHKTEYLTRGTRIVVLYWSKVLEAYQDNTTNNEQIIYSPPIKIKIKTIYHKTEQITA